MSVPSQSPADQLVNGASWPRGDCWHLDALRGMGRGKRGPGRSDGAHIKTGGRVWPPVSCVLAVLPVFVLESAIVGAAPVLICLIE